MVPLRLFQHTDQTLFEAVDFVNLLDYLYTYLEEEKMKHRYWAGQMLDKLDEEYFLAENKYLSQFFLKNMVFYPYQNV
jgi:hypothetical protein